MNREIYRKIEDELDRRRSDAQKVLSQRENEIYSTLPQIEEIEKKLRLAGLHYGKKALLGDKDAAAKLEDEIKNLNEEKYKLLKDNNYPRNYLKAPYTCHYCKDTGFIGEPGNMEKCICFKQLMIDFLYRESNVNANADITFDTFDESLYPDEKSIDKYGIPISPRRNILGIKDKCLTFIKNFKDPEEKSMYFSGPVGTGKTFILNCMAAEILKDGRTVLYLSAPALFDILIDYRRRCFNPDFDASEYKNIFDVDLLMIDDLGTETPTSAKNTELLNILNIRESGRRKTIISSNLDAARLADSYTERVASRIIGSFTLIKFAGLDLRIFNKERGIAE